MRVERTEIRPRELEAHLREWQLEAQSSARMLSVTILWAVAVVTAGFAVGWWISS